MLVVPELGRKSARPSGSGRSVATWVPRPATPRRALESRAHTLSGTGGSDAPADGMPTAGGRSTRRGADGGQGGQGFSGRAPVASVCQRGQGRLSLIHISEPTRLGM